MWRVCGNPNDRDLFKGRFQINIIVPCRTNGDEHDTITGKKLNHVTINHIVDKNADNLESANQWSGFMRKVAFKIGDLKAKIFEDPIERLNVVWFGVEKRNFD